MKRFPDRLRDSWVRRLAWACFSEPVIADFTSLAPKVTAAVFELHDGRRAWLRALDDKPAPLHDYLAAHCHSRRLGLVFEALWHFFLREDPDTTLVAHNLPVRRHGHTLGEYDAIYYCHRRRRHVHLELAVKFFMATPEPAVAGDSLSYWLGPNSRDRLDIKCRRLLSHQLPLARSDEGLAALRDLGIDALDQEILVAGWLFHGEHTTPLHDSLNPDHQRGHWCRREDFLRYNRPDQWRYLANPDWLGDWPDGSPVDETVPALAATRPVMLVNEARQRLMVAPDNWPASIA